MKCFPSNGTGEPQQKTLRKGSFADKARQYLLQVNEAQKLDLILSGIEEGKDKRQSLSGVLSQYVRAGIFFTRPFPGTFGLKEWEEKIELNQKDVKEE